MSLVVSDTSPVRALTHIGLFSLVWKYFDEVLVPPAVAAELEHPSRGFQPVEVIRLGNVSIRPPADQPAVQRLLSQLDRGEAEAVILALEVRAEALLIDESRGRAVASKMGVPITGALGLLARARRDGHLQQLKPLVDELRHGLGFYVADHFYAALLRSVGE